jgi:glutaconate CoA-transferase subunit B
MFAYWLQGGRISVGFLGGAQLDRFANINSSVIGDYDRPSVRLPGGGGAPEVAALCRQTYVVMPQTRRAFVERVDFVTSFGFGDGGDHRERLGIRTAGPTLVVTDLCLMRPDPATRELVVTSLHDGVTREQVAGSTGWPVRFADDLARTPPPTARELDVLHDLRARTARAHAPPGR